MKMIKLTRLDSSIQFVNIESISSIYPATCADNTPYTEINTTYGFLIEVQETPREIFKKILAVDTLNIGD